MAETSVPEVIPRNPTKFYTNFLYKAILVSIFLLLLPLFPSQAPEFINHTINTTSWELLQLVLVGIAVSYGLFSKRNDDTQKEQGSINAQSYVSRLLQVSSVFDDDSISASDNNSRHVHTWNSQYYRGEPIVVVAKESDDATTKEKPLLLPVRSLKNESRKLSPPGENIVLRSPIPWRSRSGRMEVKEGCSSVHEIESSPSFGRGKSCFSPAPPPPPPPPPPSQSHNSRKELRRHVRSVPEDIENRGRRGREMRFRSRSDAFRRQKEMEMEEYLWHDKEIESFIERRGLLLDEEKKEMVETGKDPSSSEEEEEEEELQDLASKKNKNGGETGDSGGGPDVDKKADEFIAKFREQIRLQRIASIRRSTSQR